MKWFVITLLLLSGCKTIESQDPPLPEGLLVACKPLPLWPAGDISLKDYYLAVSELDAQYTDCAVRHNELVRYLLKKQDE